MDTACKIFLSVQWSASPQGIARRIHTTNALSVAHQMTLIAFKGSVTNNPKISLTEKVKGWV